MASLRRLFVRCVNLVRRDRADEDLTREIASHLALLEDEYRRRGMSPEEAHRAARLALGGIEHTKEGHRDARAFRWLEDARADVRYALRSCRRRPGLSATLVCTLALGLGLGAAIFSFADGYLLRPLPFPSSERLYYARDPHGAIASALLAADTEALRRSPVGSLGFVEWSLGTRLGGGGSLLVGEQEIPVWTYDVSPGFGQTLRVPLVAGRMFEEADHRDVPTVPVWISYHFWFQAFAGDRTILNRVYRMTGLRSVDVTIVGILDPRVSSFDLNNRPPELVVPALVETAPRVRNTNQLSFPIVRLPEAMTRAEAEARISAALQVVAPATDGRARAVQLRSLHDSQVAGGAPTARVLLAGAVLVLLLVSINLVHLLLAQAATRADEIAVRLALGASRGRIARLFLTESLLLGFAGIAGGVLAGGWLSGVIAARVPQYPTAGRNLALVPVVFDARVIVIAILVGLGVVGLGALWPTWRATRRPISSTSRGSVGVASPLPARLSRIVLASELGVATVLLLGTVFIGQGIWTYLHRPLGFSYADRVAVTLELPHAVDRGSGDPRVREALATVPGVQAVGGYGLGHGQPIEIRGQAFPNSLAYAVGPGYFEAWQVPVTTGRVFSSDEIRTEAPVAMVDAAFAHRAWPAESALGQDLRVGTGPLRRVIGVVETQVRSLRQEALGEAYVPTEAPTDWPSFVVWAPGLSPPRLAATLAPRVATLLPGASVRAKAVTLDSLFLRETGEAEFQAPLMITFGVLTFVLAGIGVFGLVSYLVAQRTREFGIRLALGARGQDIWRALSRESLTPAFVGLLGGTAAAWALERFVQAGAFGWASSGIAAMIIVSVAVLGVAVIAAAGPARRTLRIDPSVVLRGE